MDVEFRVSRYDHTGNMQTSSVVTIRKAMPGDTDGDVMSDDYENTNSLDMNDPSDGLADNDDDGLSNLADSIAGVLPELIEEVKTR